MSVITSPTWVEALPAGAISASPPTFNDAAAGFGFAAVLRPNELTTGPDGLVVRIQASGGALTATNFRVYLFEDDTWARIANAGGSDVVRTSISLIENEAERFIIGAIGLSTRIFFQNDSGSGNAIVSLKRLDKV